MQGQLAKQRKKKMAIEIRQAEKAKYTFKPNIDSQS